MDHEVAKTLGELELKLRELERELASIGQRQAEAGAPLTPPPHAPVGRLVDEAIEPRAPSETGASEQSRVAFQTVPSVEQRYSMEPRETVYGEIPATKDRHETIDVAELVRFKETMQRTLQSLIDQYSRLLSLEPPSSD